MNLARQIQELLHSKIPITRAMGVEVEDYDGARLTLSTPLDRNVNHLGTAFGGSLQDAMADTLSNVSEEMYARLRDKFSEEQLLQLGAQIAFENYRARLNRGFDVESDELYSPG